MEWGQSPTAEVVLICIGMFIAQQVGGFVGFGAEWFAFGLPLFHRPWTVVTSVYAHAGFSHLAVNLIAFIIFGVVIERASSRVRFHSFVLGVGIIASLMQLVVGSFLGVGVIVLGLSGAVFGLLGYFLTSNRVSGVFFELWGVSYRWQLVVFVGIALMVTILTATEQVALVSHFTGLLLGLIAGRFGVLHSPG